MKKIILKKIKLIGLFLLTGQVLAQSAAIVLFTEKKVVANRNGIERILSRGSFLESGDEVITEKDSLVNIQYSNGALVNIGENTHYKIVMYSPTANVQIKAELSSGKVEIKTSKKIKESLKTPVISLAILGTNLRVFVASPKVTNVQVIEGLVEARNEFINAGVSVQIIPDRIYPLPFPKNGVVVSAVNAPGSITTNRSKPTHDIDNTTLLTIGTTHSASIINISII